MKKSLLISMILTIIIGALLIFMPTKVFAANGPSDSFPYVLFYNGETHNYVYDPSTYTANNTVQSGATYDKSTNTLTLNNLNANELELEVNEMGDDFKIKLVGTNTLKHITAWGFGYGGSLNITGTGTLNVHAEELETAIMLQAEGSEAKLVIASTATVNLYAGDEVIMVFDTLVSTSKNAIQIPNTTSTGTNSVKLPSGKNLTFETNVRKVPEYKSITAFKPEEYTSTYTLFTNSNDSQNMYAGSKYSSITTGSMTYENVWKMWKVVKVGDEYLLTTGEWEECDIVEDSKLASSGYTNKGTFETHYPYGPEYIEIAQDSTNKQYAIHSTYMYNSETNNYDETIVVYDIGNTITIDGKKIYLLSKNETVDGSKLTRIVEREVTYYDYNLPEKELKIVPQAGLPFTDVKSTNWYYNAVKYVYENKIINGLNETTFAPNNKLTRGMMVTILYRMEGQPKITGTPTFPDVQDSSKYYYKAVKWAVDNKIVSGYANGKFGPSDNITREQLAVILYKYAKYKGKDISKTNDLSAFSDSSKVANYALTQVKWAVGSGVITGSNGKLNPKGNATRAEVAAMMEKYCKKVGR